jgi:signal transduction histidine kinase
MNTAGRDFTPTQVALIAIYCKNIPHQEMSWWILKRNATGLQRLTEDMLDITKIKNNMVKPCKEELDLSILLSDIVMTIKIILRIRELMIIGSWIIKQTKNTI